MIPKIKELKIDAMLQESWRICPRCQGGRGEVVQIEVEIDGERDRVYKTITCSLCLGHRVVPKFPDQQ